MYGSYAIINLSGAAVYGLAVIIYNAVSVAHGNAGVVVFSS